MTSQEISKSIKKFHKTSKKIYSKDSTLSLEWDKIIASCEDAIEKKEMIARKTRAIEKQNQKNILRNADFSEYEKSLHFKFVGNTRHSFSMSYTFNYLGCTKHSTQVQYRMVKGTWKEFYSLKSKMMKILGHEVHCDE